MPVADRLRLIEERNNPATKEERKDEIAHLLLVDSERMPFDPNWGWLQNQAEIDQIQTTVTKAGK